MDRLFAAGIVLMLCAVAVYAKRAVGGDWSRSGNDMQFLLPALERDSPLQYLAGPWAGREIFEYYRPVTSVAMWVELRAFGRAPTGWQAVSLILHLASVALLVLLLTDLVRSRVAALFGAGLWAFRDRIVETVEWVPAQTDLFAGFFSVLCLWAVARYASAGDRRWALTAAVAGLLAAGSKETALVLVGLSPIVAWVAQPSGCRRATQLALGAAVLLVAFLGARLAALGGLGFLPGQAVGDGSEAAITAGSVARRLAHFLLPYPLGPIGAVSVPATWSVCLAAGAAWMLRARPLFAAGCVLAGVAAAGSFLGDVGWLLLPGTWAHFAWSVVVSFLVAGAAIRSPTMGAAVLAFGLCAALPLYHVVYNTAGNVTYLPDVYQALLWAWVAASWLQAMAEAEPKPQPSGIV